MNTNNGTALTETRCWCQKIHVVFVTTILCAVLFVFYILVLKTFKYLHFLLLQYQWNIGNHWIAEKGPNQSLNWCHPNYRKISHLSQKAGNCLKTKCWKKDVFDSIEVKMSQIWTFTLNRQMTDKRLFFHTISNNRPHRWHL